MTKEELDEIRDAEEWFGNSEYGKGRIAGFVTHLMVDYAKYYHNRQETESSRTCYPKGGESCKLCGYIRCICYRKSLPPS